MVDTPLRLRSVAHLAIVAAIALGALGGPTVAPTTAADPPRWTGAVDLYRDGVFTTQRSWLWCTAAGVQIVRNIVAGEDDHSTSGQRRYFDWMRQRNRYDLPLSAGVDPQGWTAGLRHFVDDRYRLVASSSFDGALRLAVTRLRLTGLPVALTVSHGNHGWILTGFAATADPARTKDFEITSVRVTGPLFGRQSRNGYDMAPDTKLTPGQLRRFFTPWRYDPLPMIWDGKYVSIQPVPESSAPSPTVRAAATPHPTTAPSASPALTISPPLPSPPSPTPLLEPSSSPAPVAAAPAEPAASPNESPAPEGAPADAATGVERPSGPSPWPGLVGLVALLALAAGLGIAWRRWVSRR